MKAEINPFLTKLLLVCVLSQKQRSKVGQELVAENRIVVLGEDCGSLGLEKPLRVFLRFLDCSVGAWKMRMAEEMRVMEAWFIKTVKAIL